MRIMMMVGVCLLSGCAATIAQTGPHSYMLQDYKYAVALTQQAGAFCAAQALQIQVTRVQDYERNWLTGGTPGTVEFVCVAK